MRAEVSSTRPETLLMLGDHLGSLAATRSLGRNGFAVTFADHRRLVPAMWSRFVTTRIAAPPPSELGAYADWLLAEGRRRPGRFLYAASDDLCWILAKHRARLASCFRMYQPDLATIYTLLNKQRLGELAARLGVPTPATWAPTSDAALDEVARTATYPVLIKPRTQIGLASKRKGAVCASAVELREAYRAFRAANTYHPEVVAHDPDVTWPLIQAFLPSAAANILSVAGFRDEAGHLALRASQKVFQRPRRVGVGVGFEARDVPAQAASWVRELCAATGYFGVFEVEFLVDAHGRLFLADFNPRYYGQMGFEIARGLELPWLAWLGACGEPVRLSTALARAETGHESGSADVSRFAHGWVLSLLLAGHYATGRIDRPTRALWRRWMAGDGAAVADAMSDRDDARPLLVDLIAAGLAGVRHPRSFVRTFCLDG